jgi:hypothetical protein
MEPEAEEAARRKDLAAKFEGMSVGAWGRVPVVGTGAAEGVTCILDSHDTLCPQTSLGSATTTVRNGLPAYSSVAAPSGEMPPASSLPCRLMPVPSLPRMGCR